MSTILPCRQYGSGRKTISVWTQLFRTSQNWTRFSAPGLSAQMARSKGDRVFGATNLSRNNWRDARSLLPQPVRLALRQASGLPPLGDLPDSVWGGHLLRGQETRRNPIFRRALRIETKFPLTAEGPCEAEARDDILGSPPTTAIAGLVPTFTFQVKL